MSRVLGEIDLPWNALVRADTVKMETWDVMKENGCYAVRIGFESGNQELIDTVINKKLNLKKAAEVVKYLNKIKILTHGTFTVGHYKETKEQMEQTIKYAKSIGLYSYQCAGVGILEGSPLGKFIRENNLAEHIRADTAGSAEMISQTKDFKQSAIASSLSAKIYGLEVIKKNIENESGNLTRFLVMGKNISQPEFKDKTYITSFLFKLKSKPAALYQSLGGFAINGVNLTKLQSYPEKNSFDSYFFLCDLDGHIEDGLLHLVN